MASTKTKHLKYPIKLGQFLKLINVAQDGIQAKYLIEQGSVRVNGIVNKRRGTQLQKNDTVELADGSSYVLG